MNERAVLRGFQVTGTREFAGEDVNAGAWTEIEDSIKVELVGTCVRTTNFVDGHVERKVLPETCGLDFDQAGTAVWIERPQVVASAIASELRCPFDLRHEVAAPVGVEALAFEL